MQMPPEYRGREHTWLKHRVLQLYLEAWAHKLGSVARRGTARLWYVDCFAGPWHAQSDDLRDTSIHIGLEALQSAARTWAKAGAKIELGAIFVEENDDAFVELQRFVHERAGGVAAHPLHGSFGSQLSEIKRCIGSDAAFLFVDPTGWKGAAMEFIAPLAHQPRRDVLVNVMFNDVNRFRNAPQDFIRAQMREFFGLVDADIPPGLDEEQLMSLYRKRLKGACSLRFAADLVVPHPFQERTKFRLVVGGHHEEVIRLFRDVERRVVGQEASVVRVGAKERKQFERTHQPLLFAPQAPDTDQSYKALRLEGLQEVELFVPEFVRSQGSVSYRKLWPPVLEACHITESDLKKRLWDMDREGRIVLTNVGSNDRSVKEHHRIMLPGEPQPVLR
ncbi:MAG: three-Cys-motif partner protein TcmP [Deltaproteobacteria bacterium]|nr:three-Cys-motif partner protein TcmP [Deltaproteobacteria bacterium]MBI3386740.1 three-Cys-motif partner protein TcmP [Deltaproteobacteria bacterium]